jgi:hypothetical protein
MFEFFRKKPERKLVSQLQAVLPPGFTIPPAFVLFYEWIEDRGYYVDTPNGRVGSLIPCSNYEEIFARRQTETIAGEFMEFAAEGSANVKYWFGKGSTHQLVWDRLCVFAQTGGDGSMGAFWLDDGGNQKIVHMGSGSGSMLACVLAEDPIDFLRLIAVGYEEIGWGGFSEPPDFSVQPDGSKLSQHVEFQDWVRTTFDVTIPIKGDEIVKNESEMHVDGSTDPFCIWVQSLNPLED